MRTRWTSIDTTTTSCSWPVAVQRSRVSRRSPARSSRSGVSGWSRSPRARPDGGARGVRGARCARRRHGHSARAARPEPGGRRGGAAHPARRPARRPRPLGDHGARGRDDRGRGRAGAFWRQIPWSTCRPGSRRTTCSARSRRRPTGGSSASSPPCSSPPAVRRSAARSGPTRSPSATRCRRTPSPLTSASPASSAGCGREGTRLVLVALDRLDSLGVLAGLPKLLDGQPDIEARALRRARCTRRRHPLAMHERAVVVRTVPLPSWSVSIRRASCSSPTTRSWSRTRPGSARPPCSSTARTSRSRATRSAASTARGHGHGPAGARRARVRPPRRRTGWRRCGSSRRWRGCSG